MNPSETIAAAKRSIDAFNNKDWDAAREALMPECYYDEVATVRADGVEAVIELWQGWTKTLPDAHGNVEKAYLSDDAVILELRWTGTMTGAMDGPGGEIPPTNKSFVNRGCQVIELEGDRTKAIRHYFDIATMMRQVGIA